MAGIPNRGLRPRIAPYATPSGTRFGPSVPGKSAIVGRAVDVDLDGRLVVRTGGGDVAVGAGDVEHVRTPPTG